MFTRGYMICNPPNKNSRPSPYSCWKSSVKCSPRRNGIRMTTMTHQNMFSIYLNVWKILVLFWIYMWADILGYWTMSMKNLMRSGLLKKEAKFFEKNWLGTVSDSQMFWVIRVGQKTVGWASHFFNRLSKLGFECWFHIPTELKKHNPGFFPIWATRICSTGKLLHNYRTSPLL